MTVLTYPDAYLAKFCTIDRETRAFADVDTYGTFPEVWRNKLTVLKCYVLACLENQSDPEDLFTAKLKSYRQEFDSALAQARAATPDAAGNTLIFNVPLERA
jgi:hypothetical protein